MIRIVGGADDDPGVTAHGGGERGYRGRRQRPRKENVAACGIDSGSECGLEHIPRPARVLADENLESGSVVRQGGNERLAQIEGDIDGHGKLVGKAADAVCSEVPTSH